MVIRYIIPSKGRIQIAKDYTLSLVPDAQVIVHDIELDDYHNGGINAVGIPGSSNDSLGKARAIQWAIEAYPGDWVVVLDDNVRNFLGVDPDIAKRGQATRGDYKRLDHVSLKESVQAMLELADDNGVRIAGCCADDRYLREEPYFNFRRRLYGVLYAVKAVDGIKMPQNSHEDAAMTLEHLWRDGKTLQYNYIVFCHKDNKPPQAYTHGGAGYTSQLLRAQNNGLQTLMLMAYYRPLVGAQRKATYTLDSWDLKFPRNQAQLDRLRQEMGPWHPWSGNPENYKDILRNDHWKGVPILDRDGTKFRIGARALDGKTYNAYVLRNVDSQFGGTLPELDSQDGPGTVTDQPTLEAPKVPRSKSMKLSFKRTSKTQFNIIDEGYGYVGTMLYTEVDSSPGWRLSITTDAFRDTFYYALEVLFDKEPHRFGVLSSPAHSHIQYVIQRASRNMSMDGDADSAEPILLPPKPPKPTKPAPPPQELRQLELPLRPVGPKAKVHYFMPSRGRAHLLKGMSLKTNPKATVLVNEGDAPAYLEHGINAIEVPGSSSPYGKSQAIQWAMNNTPKGDWICLNDDALGRYLSPDPDLYGMTGLDRHSLKQVDEVMFYECIEAIVEQAEAVGCNYVHVPFRTLFGPPLVGEPYDPKLRTLGLNMLCVFRNTDFRMPTRFHDDMWIQFEHLWRDGKVMKHNYMMMENGQKNHDVVYAGNAGNGTFFSRSPYHGQEILEVMARYKGLYRVKAKEAHIIDTWVIGLYRSKAFDEGRLALGPWSPKLDDDLVDFETILANDHWKGTPLLSRRGTRLRLAPSFKNSKLDPPVYSNYQVDMIRYHYPGKEPALEYPHDERIAWTWDQWNAR